MNGTPLRRTAGEGTLARPAHGGRGADGEATLTARVTPHGAGEGTLTAHGSPDGAGEGTLVLAAHGTRSAAGEATLARLADEVRAQRPGHRVELAYLEISRPLLADVLDAADGPVTVVPLLLAGGYHVHIDLPAVVERVRPDAVLARHLGPHPVLAEALARRLTEAGLRAHHDIVLGAAGSSDPAALADVRGTAQHLAVLLGRPVTAAFASGGAPSLAQAVKPGTAIASYLLAPGFFHDRLLHAGADLVTAPLGTEVAELAWLRHDEARCALSPR
ncbi:sirohydrochlorin chelatase [Nonomuraea soli]|uniref:Sirohydrochlorin ferrochelatase n=1 Tax=Nonomuraea soli TaxID=1032476 RepID=A0A7W0CRW8_9ACTN|nr:CbiX/SirB N-terminal domain-containing protein [Nonomuraea soli]MBA2896073.1 sirohydrochlorin ferrochelatase [Nonomuraea soli]